MNHLKLVSRAIATAVSATDFSPAELTRCISLIVRGPKRRWLVPLITELAETYCQGTRPTVRQLEEKILQCAPLNRAFSTKTPPQIFQDKLCELPPAAMRPAAPALLNAVPAISDMAELACVLELHPDDLGWLTQPHYSTVEHYHLCWHTKRSGKTQRLIESPKPLLKSAQLTLLRKLLEPIPIHQAATGFVPGKSLFDFVSPHCNRRMVLKMDLKDFFPGVSSGRVLRLFMTAGYPEFIATALSRLTTHAVSEWALQGSSLPGDSRLRFTRPHLPQGAPTSPALANLAAFNLDRRLAGLARHAGVRYTRYADDLLFSGDDSFRRSVRSFHIMALSILIDEGFQANIRKTRFMPSGQRQHAAGLVLNEKPNQRREDYDSLKAILHNCLKFGPENQNTQGHPDFRAHLLGRISWIQRTSPARAAKLMTTFDRIRWANPA